jgi:L,D-transpeptidase ErfK/SrfK
MRLFYFPKPPQGEPAMVITHPVGIGREGWATPLGRTKIVSKKEKPSWHVPASVRKEHAEMGDPLPAVVPPGPENPLGDHALRLAMPSYLIHGTNKPFGVGMRISHGCVRMYPEDIAALFPEIPVGTKVHIINQPYLVGRTRGSVELEVHKPLTEDSARFDTAYLVELLRAREDLKGISLDGNRIAALLREPTGVPAPIQRGAPTLESVTSRARLVRNESPDPLRVSWLQQKKPQSTGEL